jgi:predicted ATP-grasp superfamily ATP-dependent carboligase
MSNNSIVIVGVSTRSAAASCVRAGFDPICLDLFGDRDLRKMADVHVLRDLNDAVEKLQQLENRCDRSTPLMYTGGVENRPDLIEYAESRWALWGCDPRSVLAVRDPVRLAAALRAADCPALQVQLHTPPNDAGWLCKPLRSGGGLGIIRWTSGSRLVPPGCYFQEFRRGQPMSALFAAFRGERQCELIGVCRQLVGTPWLDAPEFGWSGALGDVDVPAETRTILMQIGQLLLDEFEVAGLVGIDFILDEHGIPWVTEVNPRYTGSVEVLERSLALSTIRRHAECFHQVFDTSTGCNATQSERAPLRVGKAVLYTTRDRIADTREWTLPDPDSPLPLIADVPSDGQLIPAGGPICSLLVQGNSVSECELALEEWAGRVAARVARWRTAP